MGDGDRPPSKTAEEQIATLRERRAARERMVGVPPLGHVPDAPGATPLTTEGPYYIKSEESLVRREISEDREGLPLTLRLRIVDVTTGTPVEAALVEVWHCDAFGYYSGYLAEDPDSTVPSGGHVEPGDESRFLRGAQLTDKDGLVEFQTIYPGWYHMRAIHAHLRVMVGGVDVYAGHLYFPEEFNQLVETLPPYRNHIALQRIPNEVDLVYQEAGGPLQVATVESIDAARPELGVTASHTLAVVPDSIVPDELALSRTAATGQP